MWNTISAKELHASIDACMTPLKSYIPIQVKLELIIKSKATQHIHLHSDNDFMTCHVGESWDEQLLRTANVARDAFKTSSPTTNPNFWTKIQKEIVISEPPSLADVPAHIDFCKGHGGGKNMPYIFDTLQILEVSMPLNRIASGNFFEKTCSLKLPPSELMPFMIHACVIANGIGEKERESVGITITEGKLQSLTKANKARGLQANTLLNMSFLGVV